MIPVEIETNMYPIENINHSEQINSTPKYEPTFETNNTSNQSDFLLHIWSKTYLHNEDYTTSGKIANQYYETVVDLFPWDNNYINPDGTIHCANNTTVNGPGQANFKVDPGARQYSGNTVTVGSFCKP